MQQQIHVNITTGQMVRLNDLAPNRAFLRYLRPRLLALVDTDSLPPPDTDAGLKHHRVSIRLEPREAKRLRKWSAKHGVSIAAAVRGIITSA